MKKLREILSAIDIQGAAIAVVMLVFGILFIVLPPGMLHIVCYIAGALAILWGACGIVMVIRHGDGSKAYDVVLNAVIVVAGVLLLLAPEFIADIITILLGILLIVDSIFKIHESLSLYKRKVRGWLAVAIAGAVCAALGLIVVLNPFATVRLLMIFIGVSMLVDAVLSFAILFVSAANAVKDEREQ